MTMPIKERILDYFLSRPGEYISGQEICNSLDVTRTTVWNYMNMLREDGYVFESSTKRGYKLIKTPDKTSGVEIKPFLKTQKMGRQITHFETTTSTNAECKALAQNGRTEGTVVIAEHQTHGRGRVGRSWASMPNQAIQFSILLRPNLHPASASVITQIGAAAVSLALSDMGVQNQIKWPNDILINGKKVCGILTEISCELDQINYIVIGIGVNANIPSFPKELQKIATSLLIETSKETNRASLVADILAHFEKLYLQFLSGHDKNAYLEICRSRSSLLGKKISYETNGSVISATAIELDDDGRLLVRLENGQIVPILAGEVHLGKQN